MKKNIFQSNHFYLKCFESNCFQLDQKLIWEKKDRSRSCQARWIVQIIRSKSSFDIGLSHCSVFHSCEAARLEVHPAVFYRKGPSEIDKARRWHEDRIYISVSTQYNTVHHQERILSAKRWRCRWNWVFYLRPIMFLCWLGLAGWLRVLHSHWSRNVEALLWLVESRSE